MSIWKPGSPPLAGDLLAQNVLRWLLHLGLVMVTFVVAVLLRRLVRAFAAVARHAVSEFVRASLVEKVSRAGGNQKCAGITCVFSVIMRLPWVWRKSLIKRCLVYVIAMSLAEVTGRAMSFAVLPLHDAWTKCQDSIRSWENGVLYIPLSGQHTPSEHTKLKSLA